MDDVPRSSDPEGEHADSEVGGEVERGRLGACHPDGRMRVLHGLRHHGAFGHREVLALETRIRVLGPHLHDLGENLFQHRPGILRVDPEAPELGFSDRAADAEVVTALAHDVEYGAHLSGPGGMVEGGREEADSVSDPDLLGVLGHG